MRTYYTAEVGSPCGGRTIFVQSPAPDGLDAAIDRAFGIACDSAGRELGALGPGPDDPLDLFAPVGLDAFSY